MSAPLDPRLARELKNGSPSGGWFLHGDAVRLRDEAAMQLADAALDPQARDFNYDQYQAEHVTGDQLASTIAMPPMMSDCRVVFVRDVERMKPSVQKVLQRAVAALPSDVALIVTATIPKRSSAAFYRDLKAKCRSLEWKAPKASEVPGWIGKRARERWGLDLSPDAAHWIAAAVGADLSVLDAELEKISGLPPDRRTDEVIRTVVPRTHRMDRWSWLDLVAARKYGAALKALDDVLTAERGVGLVNNLVEHHLFLGLALGGAEALGAVLKETKRSYLAWKTRIYATQAKAWTSAEIDGALAALQRADRHLKSGRSDAAVLADLLLELAQVKRGAA